MIQFKDVSKTFKSKGVTTQALQHVSLTIEDGDMFGVIGFSGAGKSTLLRMVNGLEMPTEGHVEINGQDLSKVSHNEMRKLRKSIGMVFQQFNLLDSRTVFDNVVIPLRLNKVDKDTMHKKVMELLEYVNLADKADAYPGQLSGGQKQRVGIPAHWQRIHRFSCAMKRRVPWIRKRPNRFCSSWNESIKN